MISAGTNSAFGADADQTVLLSETNSHLGHLLLEGDFEDCRFCDFFFDQSVLPDNTKVSPTSNQARGDTMLSSTTTL